MPSHSHPLVGTGSPANSGSPTGALLASGASDGRGGTATTIYATGGAADKTMESLSIGAAGGTTPVDIMNPYLVVNFIIALQGIFPSPN
jgi:microcystin-dependent protein